MCNGNIDDKYKCKYISLFPAILDNCRLLSHQMMLFWWHLSRTIWMQIRLLPMEQSDLDSYCLFP